MNLCQTLIEARHKQLLKLLLFSSVLTYVAFLLQILLYDYLLSFENPTMWSKAIYEKCGPEMLEGAFQVRSLSDFGVTAVPLGAFYGLVAQQRFTPGIIYG